MSEPRPMIFGDHHFTASCTFDGMIGGQATVGTGVELRLTGMVAGDLIVEPGAVVRLEGLVAGDTINRGGSVLTGP